MDSADSLSLNSFTSAPAVRLLQRQRPAGFLNGGLGALASFGGYDGKFLLQRSAAKDFHSMERLADQSGLQQRGFIHRRAVREVIQIAEVHHCVLRPEYGIVEPALRNAPNERHLAALEAETNAAAAAGLLSFVTLAAGLPVATALATAQPLHAAAGSGTRFEIRKIHDV